MVISKRKTKTNKNYDKRKIDPVDNQRLGVDISPHEARLQGQQAHAATIIWPAALPLQARIGETIARPKRHAGRADD